MMSYQVGDTQYVATMMNGNRAIDLGGAVVVFKLDGTAAMPIADVVQAEVPEQPATDFRLEAIRQGDDLYHSQCASCHGGIGIPSEVAIIAPDLRLMNLATHSEMQDIVLEGVRAQQGMPDFEDTLTNDQLEAIRAFIVTQARQLKQYQEDRRTEEEPANQA